MTLIVDTEMIQKVGGRNAPRVMLSVRGLWYLYKLTVSPLKAGNTSALLTTMPQYLCTFHTQQIPMNLHYQRDHLGFQKEKTQAKV